MAEKGGYADGDGNGDGHGPDGDGDGGKADDEPSRMGPPAGHAGAFHKADRGGGGSASHPRPSSYLMPD